MVIVSVIIIFITIVVSLVVYDLSAWHLIDQETTDELNCSNLFHASSYSVVQITVPFQTTIRASIVALEWPPSNFDVYLMDFEGYNNWQQGNSTFPCIESADLTSEPGKEFDFKVHLSKGTYYLVIANEYPAIFINHKGKAKYVIYERFF